MLDVRRLRTLREVALHGTIRAAAEALAFTPSAVSQQLSALERELGYELLERRGRSVHLTAAGRVLVERADAILAELADAEAEARAAAGEEEPGVRIAAFASAAATIVAEAVRGKGLRAHIVEIDPRLGLARLRAGEVDVAILWEYDYVPLRVAGPVELVPLLDDPIHVVLPRSHPAAASPSVELADLADEPWIDSTNASSCHPFLTRACLAAGFEPRVAAETNDHRTLHHLVVSGRARCDPAALAARPARVARRPADPLLAAEAPHLRGLPQPGGRRPGHPARARAARGGLCKPSARARARRSRRLTGTSAGPAV
jgi:DNA-binding transcriptional LysR family regulator